MEIGNICIPVNGHVLASGCGRYSHAIVLNTEPLQMVSLEGDMLWCVDQKEEDYDVVGQATATDMNRVGRRQEVHKRRVYDAAHSFFSNHLKNGLTLYSVSPELLAIDLRKDSDAFGWIYKHNDAGYWEPNRKPMDSIITAIDEMAKQGLVYNLPSVPYCSVNNTARLDQHRLDIARKNHPVIEEMVAADKTDAVLAESAT